jgi:hypothetical protein
MRKNWLLVMPLALAAMATGVWLAQTHYVPEPHAPAINCRAVGTWIFPI